MTPIARAMRMIICQYSTINVDKETQHTIELQYQELVSQFHHFLYFYCEFKPCQKCLQDGSAKSVGQNLKRLARGYWTNEALVQ